MTVQSTTPPDPSFLEQELLELVEERLLDGAPLDVTSQLAEAGLDSMAIVQLLLLIEDRFGLWVPEEDLTRENFSCVRSLAQVLARRLAERDRRP